MKKHAAVELIAKEKLDKIIKETINEMNQDRRQIKELMEQGFSYHCAEYQLRVGCNSQCSICIRSVDPFKFIKEI